MGTRVMQGLSVGLLVALLSGCTGSGGIHTRAYIADRERVDQAMAEGSNFGYLAGTPVPEDRSRLSKTRKVYVFEVTKDVDDAMYTEVEDVEEIVDPLPAVPQVSLPSKKAPKVPEWAKPVEVPIVDGESAAADMQEELNQKYVEYMEYTVQKDDTLQKISKKFYDSYSKWPRIYEANKDIVPDPGKISPGLVLRIPME